MRKSSLTFSASSDGYFSIAAPVESGRHQLVDFRRTQIHGLSNGYFYLGSVSHGSAILTCRRMRMVALLLCRVSYLGRATALTTYQLGYA